MVIQVRAGQILTADILNAGRMRIIAQENDQVITEQTSFEDSEISFLPEPNALYAYWLYISYSAHADADFVWRWPEQASVDVLFSSFSQAYNRSPGSAINSGGEVIFRRPANSTSRVAGGTGESNFNSAYDSGTFESGSDPSTVTMQFAQDSSDTGETRLRGGNQTRLLYQRTA
ncbi:hypothetical protein F4561_006550 [Lipingzhangella halophila]|uniref:Uncharacterized protein n=1 Tax=Lipingzhangella halophila TaxID=1783352 RepID=A0A7W7W6D8_9ACTN|nr:hypothetical protein [Lipingzhangella halophila]MBB4935641.1 hypothetical protein [Lipingzhangella halophila]